MFANLIAMSYGNASNTEGKIVSASVYAIYRGNDKSLKFQDTHKHIVFTVKLKPYI